jgi:peptidylprolyl isomerase
MKMHLLAAATVVALFASSSAALAQDTTSEKGKISYALGYRAGLEIARVTASGEQVDMQTVMLALQHAAARQDPAVTPEALGAAMQALQSRMTAKAKAALDARAADNQAKGEAFLAQNRGRAGVTVLPSGVQYRVIDAGNGARPTVENQVSVEFKSTLPDGTVLSDTSMASEGQPAGPVTVRLSEVPLPGLREALQSMPAGARWEVVLPGSQAHGTTVERAGEMANQVIIFDIRLLTVGPVLPAAGG